MKEYRDMTPVEQAIRMAVLLTGADRVAAAPLYDDCDTDLPELLTAYARLRDDPADDEARANWAEVAGRVESRMDPHEVSDDRVLSVLTGGSVLTGEYHAEETYDSEAG